MVDPHPHGPRARGGRGVPMGASIFFICALRICPYALDKTKSRPKICPYAATEPPMPLTAERAHHLLAYDPETGTLSFQDNKKSMGR
jgi:hypothetical protein